MDRWIDELAAAFGEDALTAEEEAALLSAARDVAHRVERRITPLAAFVAGMGAGRARAEGASHGRAVADALTVLRAALPGDADGGGPSA
jgi:hypothetical protein